MSEDTNAWVKTLKKTTNKFGLPEPLVRAMVSEFHFKKERRMSVTGLLNPPMINHLQDRHGAEVVEDASDFFHRLMGSSIHYVIEQAAKDRTDWLAEKRLYFKHDDWTVAGKFDLLTKDEPGAPATLWDFKTSSVWGYVLEDHGAKHEHEDQVNIYAQMIRESKPEDIPEGYHPTRARIVLIFRDWTRSKTYQGGDYPKIPFQELNVRLWSPEQAREFIIERLDLYRKYLDTPIDKIPLCSPEERWAKPDTWAVKKPGAVRASRVLDSLDEARAWIHEKGNDKMEIVERPGECTRCKSYCAVARFCPFGQTVLASAGDELEA